jgi:hypothetical protein
VTVEERLEEGDRPREAGFFDTGTDGRVNAEEVLEGTLLPHPAVLELDTRAGGPSRCSPLRVADVGRLQVHGRKQ